MGEKDQKTIKERKRERERERERERGERMKKEWNIDIHNLLYNTTAAAIKNEL